MNVLDESESTRRLLKAIHPHDDSLDRADLRKVGVDIVGARRKGHVSNIDGAGFRQSLHLRLR